MARRHSIRRTKEQWQSVLADQQNSDQTVTRYCELNEISLSNFYHWKCKLAKESSDRVPRPTLKLTKTDDWISLAPSVAARPISAWDIELNLPNGVTLKMRSA